MSLAAALSGGGGRPASFLPAIKCSNCGKEIEIASMGEHICREESTSPRAAPPPSLNNPFTLRQMNATGQKPPNMPSPLAYPNQPEAPQTRVRAPSNSRLPKSNRVPPPRINPDVANQSFLVPQPHSASPASPALSTRSFASNPSKPAVLRSMTAPMPRMFDMRPPSPELTGGYDCAFPPFLPPPPSIGDRRPSTSSGRSTPSSDRAPSRGSQRTGRPAISNGDREDTPQPMSSSTPGSETPTSGSAPKRSNTLKSLLASAGRRKSSREGREPRFPLMSVRRDQDVPPSPNLPIDAFGAIQSENLRKVPPQRPARPDEIEVLSAAMYKDEISQEPMSDMPSTFSPSQPPVPLRSTDRSRTFPRRQASDDEESKILASATSETVPESGRERRASLTADSQNARQGVPATQLQFGIRKDSHGQVVPPMPSAVTQHRNEPSHAPSESSSSAGSGKSSYTQGSIIGPSPVESAASSIDAYSPLRAAKPAYGDDEGMRVPRLNVKNPNPELPGMRAEQPVRKSPTLARPRPVATEPTPSTPPAVPTSFDTSLESPMDPAMYRRRPSAQPDPLTLDVPSETVRSPTAAVPNFLLDGQQPGPAPDLPDSEFEPYRALTPEATRRPRSRSSASIQQQMISPNEAPLTRIRSPAPPQQIAASPPPLPRLPPQASVPSPLQTRPTPPTEPTLQPRPTPLRRPTTPGTKPNCRGCTLPIEGKSVKAADGRLTGRWHKPCFTCKTCHAPFATADFYVINNSPFCEQHYHEANNSLCAGCHRGIEGHYLETTSSGNGAASRKFHPSCFRCIDCRLVLAEDYFEIAGRVYCERHALRAMKGQVRAPGRGGAGGFGMRNPGTGRTASPGASMLGRKELVAERRTTKLMMM